MSRTQRTFLIWAAVLTAVWVLVNWPRTGGGFKSFLVWAGFPWTFAHWEDGRLVWFDDAALLGDVSLGVVVVIALAELCTWSRERHRQTATGPGHLARQSAEPR